ncbi:hypothetical protein GMMP1_1240017 [Candidatus Magnetomoraceae bacterium gMMP-1]
MMGIIYVPFLISYLMLIRNGEDGVVWIFWLLIMFFACDTGAFYVGKHKLCPQVSPGKTVEGFECQFLLDGISDLYEWRTGLLFICRILRVSSHIRGLWSV